MLALHSEHTDSMNRIAELVEASPAAGLVDETGIGTIAAAKVLVAWSHPGRVRDEVAFAALAGVNPIPASSSNAITHRSTAEVTGAPTVPLNAMAMIRLVHHPETKACRDRRRAEGKTDRNIRRCITRYLAKSHYRYLNNTAATDLGVDGI